MIKPLPVCPTPNKQNQQNPSTKQQINEQNTNKQKYQNFVAELSGMWIQFSNFISAVTLFSVVESHPISLVSGAENMYTFLCLGAGGKWRL